MSTANLVPIDCAKGTCRTCLQEENKSNMVFLFQDGIVELLLQFTNLKIDEWDGLPTHICVKCYDNLKHYDVFKLKCLTSDAILRQKNLIKTEPEHTTYTNDIKIEPVMDVEPRMSKKRKIVYPVHPVVVKTEMELMIENDPPEKIANNIPIVEPEKIQTDFINKSPEPKLIKYECEMCGEVFFKKQQIEAHLQEHVGLKPFTCTVCNKSFRKWLTFRNHRKCTSIEEIFICEYEGCNKTYSLLQTLKLHKERVHLNKTTSNSVKKSNKSTLPRFACNICDKRCFKKHRLEAHLRQHQGLNPFVCEPCGVDFRKWASLVLHNKLKHSDQEYEKFVCNINGCEKSYNLKQSLKIHQNTFHFGMAHKKPGSICMCETCGKTFQTPFSLKEHTYTHTGETPFCCTKCPKKFISKYKLKIHTMRHENIRNHVCTVCGLRKTTLKELRIHMNYHTKEKSYPCPLCPSVFTSYQNISRHHRIVHRGYKPYECTYCQRTFSKAETLKHHTMTHTGEKPHACTLCDRRFIQAVALKTHMKVHNKQKG